MTKGRKSRAAEVAAWITDWCLGVVQADVLATLEWARRESEAELARVIRAAYPKGIPGALIR